MLKNLLDKLNRGDNMLKKFKRLSASCLIFIISISNGVIFFNICTRTG
jgi:hypothetical protein